MPRGASLESRRADYARRTARAQAAGYPSLAAQRQAQARARGFANRAEETAAAKAPLVAEVAQHYRDMGLRPSAGAQRRWAKRLTYRRLNRLLNASQQQIYDYIADGDDDFFYH